MKILYVTNMYPTADRIYLGIFVKEQIAYYAKKYDINPDVYFIDGVKSNLNYLKSVFEINRLLLKTHYDLVHIHFGLSGMFLLINPFIKVPVIVTLHGCDIQSYRGEGLTQKIGKIIVKKSTRSIILNDNMSTLLAAYKHKLVKIPCGIDISLFNLGRCNHNKTSFVIGFPSDRNRHEKNYPFFKKVISNLEKQGYPIEIVEFTNFTRDEVVENLSRLDCLLMTSFTEGSPQIIKEALACNVPIISSRVGDVDLLLQNVDNCSIIDDYDETLFADKIKELILLKPEERVTNGRDRIIELGFDQDSISSKLHALYLSVTGEAKI
jgi:teichuronic acid biosynthesis glycosyltransferase TuaC